MLDIDGSVRKKTVRTLKAALGLEETQRLSFGERAPRLHARSFA